MRDGSAPASIRRSSRSISSLVLPDPAEAATKADTPGSDASCCRFVARAEAAKGIAFKPIFHSDAFLRVDYPCITEDGRYGTLPERLRWQQQQAKSD